MNLKSRCIHNFLPSGLKEGILKTSSLTILTLRIHTCVRGYREIWGVRSDQYGKENGALQLSGGKCFWVTAKIRLTAMNGSMRSIFIAALSLIIFSWCPRIIRYTIKMFLHPLNDSRSW